MNATEFLSGDEVSPGVAMDPDAELTEAEKNKREALAALEEARNQAPRVRNERRRDNVAKAIESLQPLATDDNPNGGPYAMALFHLVSALDILEAVAGAGGKKATGGRHGE